MKIMQKIGSFFLAVLLCLCICIPAAAEGDLPRLWDEDGLLSETQQQEVLALLDEISERQQADFVVVTAITLGGKSPMEYADDFYDEHHYADDGVLLLICMEDRDWWISTKGFGITALTDRRIDQISDAFLSDLSNGDYASAFETFAQKSDAYFTRAKNSGTAEYDETDSGSRGAFQPIRRILICFGIGFVIALIVTGVMRGKLKSVRFQPKADDYLKEGSMQLTENRDLFLYSHLDRRAKPKDNGSSGGSSTHVSSSGSTHGGGGGKF